MTKCVGWSLGRFASPCDGLDHPAGEITWRRLAKAGSGTTQRRRIRERLVFDCVDSEASAGPSPEPRVRHAAKQGPVGDAYVQRSITIRRTRPGDSVAKPRPAAAAVA